MKLNKESRCVMQCEKIMKKVVTIDTDGIVPDSNGDIGRIICSKSNVNLGNITVKNGCKVEGECFFELLYLPMDSNIPVCLYGKINFDTDFLMTEESKDSFCRARAKVKDLTVNIINSRKYNCKALIEVEVIQTDTENLEIVNEITDAMPEVLYDDINITSYKKLDSDTIRFNENVVLPKNMPNIERIIFKDVRIKQREIRCYSGKLSVKLEIGVFIVYMTSEETIESYEGNIFVENSDSCNVTEDTYVWADVSLYDYNVKITDDSDGEGRIVSVSGNIKCDIESYEEEKTTCVVDMYSVERSIDTTQEKKTINNILLKNSVKVNANNSYKMKNDDIKVERICYSYGDAFVDENICENGELKIKGYVDCNVLYKKEGENGLMEAVNIQLPFEKSIMTNEDEKHIKYAVCVNVDNIMADYLPGNVIEVRSVLDISAIIWKNENITLLCNAIENPEDTKDRKKALVGYCVGENEKLWDIAKKYNTTRQALIDINNLSDENVKFMDKIIIKANCS